MRTVRLRLPRRTQAAFAGCAAFALVGLALALTADGRVVGLLCVGFFGGLALAGWALLPREIVFEDRALVVHRRLLSPRRIRYTDITGYGLSRITSRAGRLAWGSFENGHEVDRALLDLLEAGKLSEQQLDDDVLKRDLAGLEAGAIGVLGLVAVVLVYIFFLIVGAPSWFWALPEWVREALIPLAAYLAVTGVAYAWLRRAAAGGNHDARA